MNTKSRLATLFKSLCFVVGFAFTQLPQQALAQTWIVGGAVGSAQQDDYEIAGQISTRDDSDTSGRVFGGYLMGSMQAVVVSYIDLGTTRFDGPAFGGFEDFLDAEGFDISYLAGWAPGSQQRFSLFGTIGVFSWDQDVRLTDSSGDFDFRDEGTSFSVGVGAEINLGSSGASPWGINVAYQLFKDVGDAGNSGHEYDRDVFSLGVNYRFGQGD